VWGWMPRALSRVAIPKHPSGDGCLGAPISDRWEPIGIWSRVQWVVQAVHGTGRALKKLLAWVQILSGLDVKWTRKSRSVC